MERTVGENGGQQRRGSRQVRGLVGRMWPCIILDMLIMQGTIYPVDLRSSMLSSGLRRWRVKNSKKFSGSAFYGRGTTRAGQEQGRRCDGGQARFQHVAGCGQEQTVSTRTVSGCPAERMVSARRQGSESERPFAFPERAEGHGRAAE